MDVVILVAHNLLDRLQFAIATQSAWRERNGELPPAMLPPLPRNRAARYEQLAAKHDLAAATSC